MCAYIVKGKGYYRLQTIIWNLSLTIRPSPHFLHTGFGSERKAMVNCALVHYLPCMFKMDSKATSCS